MKMKVLYIVESYGATSETFVSDLLEGLSNLVELSVIVDRNLSLNKKENFSIYESKFVSKYSKLITYIERISIKRTRYDLRKRVSYFRISQFIKKINPDVVYIDFGPNAILSYTILDELKIPFIVHFHGYDASKKMNDLSYKKEIKNVFNSAKSIIVASEFIKNRLLIAGCNPNKISLIRLGINIEKLMKTVPSINKTPHPSLIHIGRLVEKKHPIVLLHSFKEVLNNYPETKLTIIGDGPMYHDVKKCIKNFNIEKSVRLLKELNREDVLIELASHWIYTQHCVTSGNGDQEGFSVSMLEAAFFKLPVISTIHNGIPENVVDGKTGFLVREYDYISMAKKIIELLDNTNLINKMGEYGHNRVISKFTIKNRIDNIINLLSTSL